MGRWSRPACSVLFTAMLIGALLVAPKPSDAVKNNPPGSVVVMRAETYDDWAQAVKTQATERFEGVPYDSDTAVRGEFVVGSTTAPAGPYDVVVTWDDGQVVWRGRTRAAGRVINGSAVTVQEFEGAFRPPDNAFPGDHLITARTPQAKEELRAIVTVRLSEQRAAQLAGRVEAGDIILTHQPTNTTLSLDEALDKLSTSRLLLHKDDVFSDFTPLYFWWMDYQFGDYWQHAAMVVPAEVTGQGVRVVESGDPASSAEVEGWLRGHVADGSDVMVFRIPDGVADAETKRKAAERAWSQAGKTYYDYSVLAAGTHGSIPGRDWLKIQEGAKRLNGGGSLEYGLRDTSRMYCSEIVWHAYADNGLTLVDADVDDPWAMVPPEDLFAAKDDAFHFIRNVPRAGAGMRSATSLVVDVSGSMGLNWRDGVKIASAKAAADSLTRIIEGQAQQSGSSDGVAVTAFSDVGEEVVGLTPDLSDVRDAIARLSPTANTNIGDGLRKGLGQLQKAPQGAERLIVLLSDGQNNAGMTNDDIMDGPVADAEAAGVRIYTVGFGDPGDIDEDLLRQIATRTGGEYFPAGDAMQLSNVYIRIAVSTNASSILGEFSGTVAQGELATPGSFEVTAGAGVLEGVLNWPGSVLDLRLTDPRGTQVATGYPGLTYSASSRPQQLFIERPIPGEWKVGVFGAEVSMPEEPYYVLMASREGSVGAVAGRGGATSNPGGLLLGIGLATFAGLGLLTWASSNRTSQTGASVGESAVPPSPFILMDDQGRRHPLRTGLIAVGRAGDNDVVIDDPSVSRHHAVLDVRVGVVIVDDLRSRRGTYLNGLRIERAEASDKDSIGFADARFMLVRGEGAGQ